MVGDVAGPGVGDCSGDSPGLGVENCSEVGDSPGRGVEDCSEVGDWPGLVVEDCSEVGDWLGLGVEDCSALGDSPGEQVRFGLAQELWPAEHFGQLGQRSAQLLQYSTGTAVVR